MCTRGDQAKERLKREARMELRVWHKSNSRLFTIYGALEINFLYLSVTQNLQN